MGMASIVGGGEGVASTDTIPAQVPEIVGEITEKPLVVEGAVPQEERVDSVVDSGIHSEPTLSLRKISTGERNKILHRYTLFSPV